MALDQSERSFAQLFTDAIADLTALFRTEMRLAKAEVTEKIGRTAAGLGIIGIGAVLLMAALVILLEAIVAGLVAVGLAPHWAALLVAVVTGLVGGGLLSKGIADLKPANLTPDRTLNQLQRDVDVAKEQVR